ncbi:MAG: O-antigen polysaccharide polymerase Wzy [Polaribacter sp.]
MVSFKSFFVVVYLTLSAFLFITFSASILVWSSFFCSALVLLLITIYHLYYEKNYSPILSSYIVFNYLFFIAAPISQINSFLDIETPKFANLFVYKDSLAIYANILIILFNTIFISVYITLKKKVSFKEQFIETSRKQKYLPFVITLLLIISILTFFSSFTFIKEEFTNPNWLKSDGTSKSMLLIWKKFMFMIPLTGVILCYSYFKKKNKIKNNYHTIVLFLIIFIFLLFWFKNPLTEKRNALGPIYLSLLFLFFPKLLNSNLKMISFLFFSMIIIFPLMAIITHSDATLSEILNSPSILIGEMKGGGITEAFNTLNYDAYSSIMVTIEWVHNFGFSYGYQLLGGLFFFVPRSIWTLKPYSSGQVIGEYLIDDYGFNFTNLSNPLVSEGFMNFGLIGVLFFPFLLAYFSVTMIKWLHSKNLQKKIISFYFAMHLLFLLRGDFTNGFAYFVGPFLAIYFLPKFLYYLTYELTKLK